MAVQSIDLLISAAAPSDTGGSRNPSAPVFQVRVVESPNGRLESPAILPLNPASSGYVFGRGESEIVIPVTIDGVTDADHAKEIGAALYNALTSDDRLQDLVTSAIGGARAVGTGARLRFQIEPRAMRRIPLELLYRESEGFLTLARDLSIVRYLPVSGQPIRTLIVPPPLHILIVTFAPRDLPPLDANAEIRRIRDALSMLESEGIVAIQELRDPSLDVLRRTLREQHIEVLHLIGHGDYRTETPLLALTKPDGSTHLVSAETFSINLAGADTLRLVVFNACDTAIQSTTAAMVGIAPQVMQLGNLPATVAMSSTITDGSAVAFAQGFYRAVGRGDDIDTAMREGRIAIFNRTGTGTKGAGLAREFAIPVLFLRPADARLIEFPSRQAERILETLTPQDGREQFAALADSYARVANWKSVHDHLQSLDTGFALVEVEIERVLAAAADFRFARRGWAACRSVIDRLKALARDPATVITVTPFNEQSDGAITGDAWIVEIAVSGRGIERALESDDEAVLLRESRALRRAMLTYLNVSDKALVDLNRDIQRINLTFTGGAAAEIQKLHHWLDERTAIHAAINNAAAAFRPVRDLAFQPPGNGMLDRIERAWSYVRSNALDSRLFPEAEARGDLARNGALSGAAYAVELVRAAEGLDQALQLAFAAKQDESGAVQNAARTFDSVISKHAFLADQALKEIADQLRALAGRWAGRWTPGK